MKNKNKSYFEYNYTQIYYDVIEQIYPNEKKVDTSIIILYLFLYTNSDNDFRAKQQDLNK